jgi:RNA polymerase sigma-70 factor, ECF subfamily
VTVKTDDDDLSVERSSPSPVRSPVDAAMERYATGDDSAFAELYDLLAPRLYGYLLRQTRNQSSAEDLLQQTLLQIHRARGRFLVGAEVTPWAFAIARRLLIDGVRRRKREGLTESVEEGGLDGVPSTDPSAQQTLEAHEVAGRLSARLATIPEQQREAFHLIKEEGLTLAEAAEVLGTTVAAVKLRAHRAYSALKGVRGDRGEKS